MVPWLAPIATSMVLLLAWITVSETGQDVVHSRAGEGHDVREAQG